MPSIAKPRIPLAPLVHNELGLTIRDYEGEMSTLCAGCGHDSVTAAISLAFFELSIRPRDIAKLSGIGCSSKTPTYFINGAHGFNSAHGRMAAIATGAVAAHRGLHYIGVSGDGDSLSIGLGHLSHAIRRNIDMTYIIENNGVYGLTKGQVSPSADVGSRPKKGDPNVVPPIDPMELGLAIGATFLARGFSGDKDQLVPLIKAAVAHRGFALLDVISPCVSFNDHEGSTKSYRFFREHEVHEIEADYVPQRAEIRSKISADSARAVTMHDGSVMYFRALPEGYDPTNRLTVESYLAERKAAGEVPTGLLYVKENAPDLHDMSGTIAQPLVEVSHRDLCPGSEALAQLQRAFR